MCQEQRWLEEGNKLFDSLVKVGEELESKTVDFADNTVGKVTEKAKESVTDTKDKVEKILDTGVNHSLNRIGLVTPKDLQHIEQLLVQCVKGKVRMSLLPKWVFLMAKH